MSNVPDDWGCHYVHCEFCGRRYHASEGGCDCPGERADGLVRELSSIGREVYVAGMETVMVLDIKTGEAAPLGVEREVVPYLELMGCVDWDPKEHEG